MKLLLALVGTVTLLTACSEEASVVSTPTDAPQALVDQPTDAPADVTDAPATAEPEPDVLNLQVGAIADIGDARPPYDWGWL